MPTLTEESTVLAKTLDLCASILEEPDLKEHIAKVEAFVADTESRSQFIKLNEAGDALHKKQHAGEQLTPEELAEFKTLQSAALENAVINDFFAAQEKLQGLHSQISGYVAKTLELGRVPTDEDFAEEGGGGCGEGCGCH